LVAKRGFVEHSTETGAAKTEIPAKSHSKEAKTTVFLREKGVIKRYYPRTITHFLLNCKYFCAN
jgi:hypothetical protein